MFKLISVDQSRIGMHIHEVHASWVDNPFWKKSFKLKTDAELQKLRTSGIKEVTIDTEKGFDVLAEIVAESVDNTAPDETPPPRRYPR